MLVCSECFCSECAHEKEKVEIDDEILDTIKLLNDKGYKTDYCCGGHVGEKRMPCMYVRFDWVKVAEGVSKLPETLPNDKWYCLPRRLVNHHYVYSHKLSFYEGSAMYFDVKTPSRKKDSVILAELEEQRKALYEWAKQLE